MIEKDRDKFIQEMQRTALANTERFAHISNKTTESGEVLG